ncbi:MAG: A/G-specific adenine glycosylase [Burkholderiales bacterium]|nr:A/G-specific adenine glycosylase [Burkholderiales bacterium]
MRAPRRPQAVPPEGDSSVETGFAQTVITWQHLHGRHDLPWQGTRDPYRIWVSEIMLQQTQVAAVIGYFARFMARFPDVQSLAAASIDDVLACWSGLGYYSRARNLHACAALVVSQHGGAFPQTPEALQALPGVGPSTAAAIAAFAWGVRAAILDGNVKRVLCRRFGIEGFPGERTVEARLWSMARAHLPADGEGRIEAYTQGLMDLGATVCTRSRPACARCPLSAQCEAYRTQRVALLPTPRPTRKIEQRDAAWVVLVADGAVLLERRAPAGLWGGLWSLPELRVPQTTALAPMTVAQVADAVRDRFGIAGPVPARLAPVRHVFTHFRLLADVWRMDVPNTSRTPIAGHEWLALCDAPRAPLPQPVKTLLGQFTAQSDAPLERIR